MEDAQLAPDMKTCEKCGQRYEDWYGGGHECPADNAETPVKEDRVKPAPQGVIVASDGQHARCEICGWLTTKEEDRYTRAKMVLRVQRHINMAHKRRE